MTSRWRWLTPDEPSEGGYITRSLHIPIGFEHFVMGALEELCLEWNWEEHGDMTPDECASLMDTMWGSVSEDGNMIGFVQLMALATMPDTYLACDGVQHDRVDYPDLYAALDSAYIVDADHFVTPDYHNRVPVGAGDTYEVGDEFGEAEHTLIVDEIPAHSHEIPWQSTFPYGDIPEVTVTGGLLTTQTGSTGGDGAHNNLQPSHAIVFAIKAKFQ